MRHARLTRFVDRIMAISMVCLVCAVLIVAGVVEAARLRLSRAYGATLPASRSRLAALRALRVPKSRLDASDMARPIRVVPFTPRAVGVSSLDAALARECVELDGETGSFI